MTSRVGRGTEAQRERTSLEVELRYVSWWRWRKRRRLRIRIAYLSGLIEALLNPGNLAA